VLNIAHKKRKNPKKIPPVKEIDPHPHAAHTNQLEKG
jgi:hypothetical protein